MPSKNGSAPRARKSSAGSARGAANRKVRVAIVGVGNCASSLVQGVQYYRNASSTDKVPGLMHVDLGGYHIRDIEFVAAFDIDREKVGKDLSQAIFSGQNNTVKFSDVPRLGVKVHRGMTHDGLGKYLKEVIHKAPGKTDDVVGILKKSKADVLVNYLPVGSEAATRWYMEQALAAGVAVVNCMPVFIAREDYWEQRFAAAGLPILGDDIKSQVGATIVHRVHTRLFEDRGVQLENTYQLNFGGNTDFLNMLERERLESKKISKTNAVTSQLDKDINPKSVHVGPSDYVPWLNDRKWAFIRLEGKSFGDVPLNMELKLEVHDSPNSAGIVIDAVRFCKLALDNGISGSLYGPSSWLMKSPPAQYTDDVAHRLAEEFIARPVAHPQQEGRDWHSPFASGHATEIAPAPANSSGKSGARRASTKAEVPVTPASVSGNGNGHVANGASAEMALAATPVATPRKGAARKKTAATR
ncbi:MAG: myo-inositol-1-phosphate synthase [Candidatus Dormibacteria bacterium]